MVTRNAAAIAANWSSDARWNGIERPYSAEDVVRLSGSVEIEHTLAERGAARLWDLLHTEEYVAALGALTGNQAVQQVKAGLKAIYLSGWQVAADANLSGHMYPDQSLYPSTACRTSSSGSTRRSSAPTRSTRRGQERHRLVRADRRRRRGRLRRPAERLRADEGHDRGRRRGRALRGPARLREEVRPHGRQGAGPDVRLHPHADRGAPGGRRLGRADAARRAHRRRQREAADERRRRARPPVPDRRAHARGLLPHQRRPRRRHRARARLRAVRGSDLVRDLEAGPLRGQALRRGDPREVPGQAARVQLLAVLQLEEEPRRRDDREASSRSSGRWATSSSSSRSPASTR